MYIISSLNDLKKVIGNIKDKGNTIGFVPTMGALHQGHLSLVNRARDENDIIMVSIFVNPTQFNDKTDLANYPRMPDKDAELLNSYKVDYIFLPTEQEMYPEPDNMIFNLGGLDRVLEGKYRPGHFNGVAQIVYKFLINIQPDKAYFGEKDFQQLVIIKQLVGSQNLKVDIVSCPIVREPDGLAMSSRNMLLTPEQRKHAVLISKYLVESTQQINTMSVKALKEWVKEKINEDPLLEVEYFEIVNDKTLADIDSWDDNAGKVGLVAVRVGKIRLIDNIRYNL